MNWLRPAALCALCLVSMFQPPASAQLPTVEFYGGVEHSEQFPDGSSSSIADNGGITYLHYEAVSQEVGIRPGINDGDEVRFNWIKPTRTESIGLIWDGPGHCWQEVGYPDQDCWDLPLLRMTVYSWIDQAGDWVFETRVNNQQIHSESFRVVGYTLVQLGAGSRQGPADSTLAEPLEVQLLEYDGETPVAGEYVRFTIDGGSPGDGFGLSASYNDPPSGTATSSLAALSDAQGIARVWVELGDSSASFSVTASSSKAPGYTPSFSISAIAPEPVDQSINGLDEDKNLGRIPAGQCVGNPINVISGNKFQRETDLRGASPVPLEFSRYYNSRDDRAGPLGFGWRHHFQRSISLVKEGKGKTASSYALLNREDGRRLRFQQVGDNWVGDADIHWALLRTKRGWELRLDDDSVERYDRGGSLLSITARNGASQQLSYSRGRLDQVTSDSGERLQFTYTSDGLLQFWDYQAYDNAPPRRWVASYQQRQTSAGDTLQLLAAVMAPDARQRHYLYQDNDYPGALTGISDEVGRRQATWTYDGDGFARRSYHGSGAGYREIDYGPDGQRTILDSAGNQTGVLAQASLGQGLLSQSHGPLCDTGARSERGRTVDPLNNSLLAEVADGVTTAFGDYDSRGNPGYRIEAAGSAVERRTEFEYDPRFANLVTRWVEPSVLPGQHRVTLRTYDDRGTLLSHSVEGYAPDGTAVTATTRYTWDGPFGQLTSVDGPRIDLDDSTHLSYYPVDPALGANSGMLRRVTGPGNVVERDEIQYNALRRVASEQRPNGLSLSYEWDLQSDRLLSLSERAGGIERSYRWSYTAAGEVASLTTPDGNTLFYEYDDAARLVALRDSGGNRIDFQLDAEGNVSAETYTGASGELVSRIERSFDAYHHLDRITSGGASHDHDAHPDGRLARATDGNGVETLYDYDELRRLVTRVADATGSDPATADASTRYQFDLGDEPVAVTAPNGATTAFQYDDLGQVVLENSPDRGVLTYTRDGAGNALQVTDASGGSTRRSFDARDRLIAEDLAGTAFDSLYQYDGCHNGLRRLCQARRGDVVLDYQYNGFGEITSISQTVNGTSSELDFSYIGGHLGEITYPNGAILTYHYDSAGLVSGVDLAQGGASRVVASGIRYAPLGPLQALEFGNGGRRNIGFDQAYRISSIDDPAYTVQLSYDGASNIARVESSTGTRLAGYDALDRLTAATNMAGDHAYRYDLNGNRLYSSADGIETRYEYEPYSNRLAVTGATPVSLDARGNTLSLRGQSLEYSPDNRLTEVTGVASYRHNALGQRVEKSTADGSVYFIYGPQGHLLGELDSTGQVDRLYIYLEGQPLATVDYRDNPAGDLYFVHNDHLGTPQAMTDETGRVVWRAGYRPFGLADVDEDPDSDGQPVSLNLRFPGQYFDAETGLHYNYFRDYDPQSGRYVQSDPIGLGGGLNTYSYVDSNPWKYSDRLGLRRVGQPRVPDNKGPESVSCLQRCQGDVIAQSLITDVAIFFFPQAKIGQLLFKAGAGASAVGSTAYSLASCVLKCDGEDDQDLCGTEQ